MKFLQLDFIPRSTDLGLLVLRLWLGLSMFVLHGLVKIQGFEGMAAKFESKIGLGAKPEFMLLVIAESVCAILIVLGLFTRIAAVFLIVAMGVAFFVAHGMKLSGPGSGELAFVYLAGFVALFITGAGNFSADAKLGGGRR
ncbi:MAG: DoxX family protein [Verrucomicrobium sp.]|nr:DoxX family protein [Verrucomicrobium sp.]